MLDFLFNGLYKIISGAVGALLSVFMEAFQVDLAGFKNSFPGLDTLFGVLQGISFGLLLMIIFYACIKNFYTPASNTTENPLWVLLKAIPAAFLIINANLVVDAVFSIGSAGYNLISAAALDTEWGDTIGTAIGSFSIGIVAPGIAGASALLGLILFVFFTYHLLKFLLECVERYVTVCIVCYISPISYCAIASKGTISFFSNFFSMLAGQMLLMWVNAWSLKMISAGLEGLATNTSVEGTSFFFKYIVLIAFTIVAQKMDNLLQQVGFHNIRGGGGNSMMMGAGIVAMAAGRAIKGVQGLVSSAGKTLGDKGGKGVGKPTSDTTKQTSGIGNRGNGYSEQQRGSSNSLPRATAPVGNPVITPNSGSSGSNPTTPKTATPNAPKTVNHKPADHAGATSRIGAKGAANTPASTSTSTPASTVPIDTTGNKGAGNPIESMSENAPIDTTGTSAAMGSGTASEAPTANVDAPVDTTASAGSVSAPDHSTPIDNSATTVSIGSSPVSNASSETVNVANTAVSTDTTGGDSITVHSKPEATPSGTQYGGSASAMSAAPPHSAVPANTPPGTAAPTVNPRTPTATPPASTSHAKAMVNEVVQNHQAANETKRITTMEQQTPSAQRHATDIQQGRAGHPTAQSPHQGKKK